MKKDSTGVIADLVCVFPEKFLSKEVNEPFIQKIMGLALERKNWVQGDATKFEPDYFCDGVPFEFTIASDRKRKGNFIQRFHGGQYTSDDVEKDVFQYINESVHRKMEKNYSVPNVHLCVLCLLDMTSWVLDKYGSITHALTDGPRKQFFAQLRNDCIDTHVFNNIFIIFPDMDAKWWVWDVLTGHRVSIRLSDADILSRNYPYIVDRETFDKIQATAIPNVKNDT